LKGSIPSFISITDAKLHDVNILDELIIESGAICVMDRAYLDFYRLYQMHQGLFFFVLRAKRNTRLRRLYSACDQTVVPINTDAAKAYPEKLRRIKYYDREKQKRFVFLTNNFVLSASTIADHYKCRWQVELFFKWIKQHLSIKSFFGYSENAVKTQIRIAISIYVLVAIMKKRLWLHQSLYTIVQVISIALFEKVPIYQLVNKSHYKSKFTIGNIQLNLFDS